LRFEVHPHAGIKDHDTFCFDAPAPRLARKIGSAAWPAPWSDPMQHHAALLILALGWPALVHAQVRGVLKFHDGNVLPGTLIESAQSGGLLHSDRFGDVRFAAGEATFEPAPAEEKPTSQLTWQPTKWSIGLSGYWQSTYDSTESDFALDLAADWVSDQNELKASLSTDYKVVSKEVDNNEQKAQVRWLRNWSSPWVSIVGLRAHRSDFTLDPYPSLDYVMYQGTLGGGVREAWSDDARTLFAIGYERVVLEVLNRQARIHARATSFLVESNVKLTQKINFDQTLYLYAWQSGGMGVDSQAEVSYAITQQLSVGLRHEYRRNAVNLDIGSFNKLSLTTRLAF